MFSRVAWCWPAGMHVASGADADKVTFIVCRGCTSAPSSHRGCLSKSLLKKTLKAIY